MAYTGARFKANLLVLLSENPLDTRPGAMHTLVRCDEMGHLRIAVSLANLSVKPLVGVLPLSDLAEVEAALDANRALQIAYAEAKQRQEVRNASVTAIRTMRDNELAEAILEEEQGGRYVTQERKDELEEQVFAKWQPQLDRLDAERQADFARAEPGMARHHFDYRTYLDEVEARVLAKSGLTYAEEQALFAPSAAWQQEWFEYLNQQRYKPSQMLYLRALRSRSADCDLLTIASAAHGSLSKVGSIRLIFTQEEAQRHIAFSNQMAMKRRHFPEQAVLLSDEKQEETEAPGL